MIQIRFYRRWRWGSYAIDCEGCGADGHVWYLGHVMIAIVLVPVNVRTD